ncbi:MFS transporter [Phormidesmis sp. 146-33]
MPSYLVWVMAIASGATVANLYYNQPLLATIAQGFQASSQAVGLIPMLTQIGYAVGILLFVPLGDLLERRRLIVSTVIATAFALVLAAIAPSLPFLIAASFGIGMTAIAAQIIVPFATQLTAPQNRGNVVGIVMGGLFVGILLARTVSGFVGAIWGWRAMYWLASGLMGAIAVMLAIVLPKSQPSLKVSYPRLMKSLWQLMVQQPVLQESSLIGAMSFGVFSAFWSTLVFLLREPPYQYGSEVTGLFGLVGVVGAVVAPIVGRVADRRSPTLTIGLGLTATTLSFLVFWSLGHQIWGLIFGVILLDLGVQSTQISNQSRIYSLPPEIHSRLNALYIMLYFMGGAIGSFLGAYGWNHWQWNGVCAVSSVLMMIAIATFLTGKSRRISDF